MPKLKKAAFWGVAGLLMLVPVVLAELYLRSIGLGNPILFYANASYRFAPLPNQQQVRQHGAKVTIDSKGLRSSVDWSGPADGKLLFIGDSVTWGGTYIDDRQLFSDGVCQRLAAATGKRYICGNAGANQYGTDNMAERVRYKNVNDESVLVVTLIAPDAIRGRVDAEGRYFFMQRPPPPFRALWEATTFLTWVLYKKLRPQTYRSDDDFRVAERSVENMLSAIRETQRPGRKVLIVLSPIKAELNGKESLLTKQVQSMLARSGLDWIDLHGPISKAVTPDFYYDEVHLNVRGHAFYAEQIAARLKEPAGGEPRERPTAARSGGVE
jgi:lysophospholipase L1-like esterase